MKNYSPADRKKFETRKKTIGRLLNQGKTYVEIGQTFGITQQRVYQIANVLGLGDRWGATRKAKKKIFNEVNKDIRNNRSINEILERQSVDKQRVLDVFRELSGENLKELFRIKRNKRIVGDYVRGNTAKEIITSDSKVLLDPIRIRSVDSVYAINTRMGVRKYPQIGKRCAGGIFESKKILKYIAKKYDKNGWTFETIADKLNSKGLQTICGLPFQTANTRVKYHSYNKNKK